MTTRSGQGVHSASPARGFRATQPRATAKASGANNAIREIGGVFGVAVLAAVFSARGSYATPGVDLAA